MENWRQIEGCKPIYQVSDKGRVRSVARTTKVRGGISCRKEHYLKPASGNGYLRVILFTEEGKRVHALVHQLVAKAFIPNPDNCVEVDHIDGNRANNEVKNLRWSNRKENCNNPLSIEKHKAWVGEKAKRKRSIRAYDLSGNLVGEWPTITIAARETGTGRVGISAVAKGKRKTANNLIWKYNGPECTHTL